MIPIRSVAVIGAGPAGIITIDALSQEQTFDVIRVFERREEAGGCWLQDPPTHTQELPDISKLASRTADTPLSPPPNLPAMSPKSKQYRFSDTSLYPHLETNIDAGAMSFSQEPIPNIRSEWSIQKHGADTPFRHWSVVQDYLLSLLKRHNYSSLVSYNTTVELVKKNPNGRSWILTLRRNFPDRDQDYWWTEEFDSVVVASGHYQVPYIPRIAGLPEYASRHPGSVIHSKAFRDPEFYRGKRVVTVGASVSGADIASSLASVVEPPLYAVVRGKYHPYFFDYAFQHPKIERRPPIACFESWGGARTVVFEDGTRIEDVDYVIFGTGYSWTLPFLEKSGTGIKVENERVPGLYQHVFWRDDPTLCFVGAVAAGFTFKIYEWQAVLAARFLARRISLPSISAQVKWEEDRVAHKGDGIGFTIIYPDFEDYFEEIRLIAGEPLRIAVSDDRKSPPSSSALTGEDVSMTDTPSQSPSTQRSGISPAAALMTDDEPQWHSQSPGISPHAVMLHTDFQEYLDAMMAPASSPPLIHNTHTQSHYHVPPRLLSTTTSDNGIGGGSGNPVHAAMLHEDFQEFLDTMMTEQSPLDPTTARATSKSAPELPVVEVGRRLPKFEKWWRADFDAGHLKRIEMWKNLNREAREEMEREMEGKVKHEMDGPRGWMGVGRAGKEMDRSVM